MSHIQPSASRPRLINGIRREKFPRECETNGNHKAEPAFLRLEIARTYRSFFYFNLFCGDLGRVLGPAGKQREENSTDFRTQSLREWGTSSSSRGITGSGAYNYSLHRKEGKQKQRATFTKSKEKETLAENLLKGVTTEHVN